ncbi:MAG: type II toxin-antitoxin system RelE/ParE family toxin [Parabacteroides sp.]|nr:type II toxin-antitoxin system RelE/ParE family toxin [Eubacteriales bacterium]MDD4593266.1 type II toxin-antitoxin system RelE/ParE family toxin [Parabacteroides sp.]
MGKFKIRIYKSPENDLEDTVEYINTLSPDAAIKQYDNLINKIGTLVEMPERCPFLKDASLRLKGYRVLIVNNYLVVFVIKDDTVQVRRILYNKRNYGWLL